MKTIGVISNMGILRLLKTICILLAINNVKGVYTTIENDVINQLFDCHFVNDTSKLFSCSMTQLSEVGTLVEVDDILHNQVTQPKESWKFRSLLCQDSTYQPSMRSENWADDFNVKKMTNHWGFTEDDTVTISTTEVLLQTTIRYHKYQTGEPLSSLLQLDPECGQEISGKQGGVLTSTNIGKRKCEWKIIAQQDEEIQIFFTKFNTKHSSGCYNEKLTIFDGLFDNDDVIGKYCGRNSTSPSVKAFEPISSNKNAVTIVFESQGTLSWEIEWSVVKKSGLASFCDMYQGMISEVVIDCYNVIGSSIDCGWYFQPTSEEQTILYLTVEGGPSTCYHLNTINPSKCSDNRITQACDTFVVTETWPVKVDLTTQDGVPEQMHISHMFFQCQPNICISSDGISDVISTTNNDVTKEMVVMDSHLTLVSKLLISCLVVSILLNAILCYCYVRRSQTARKTLLECENQDQDIDYVNFGNNQLYTTSAVSNNVTHDIIKTKNSTAIP